MNLRPCSTITLDFCRDLISIVCLEWSDSRGRVCKGHRASWHRSECSQAPGLKGDVTKVPTFQSIFRAMGCSVQWTRG